MQQLACNRIMVLTAGLLAVACSMRGAVANQRSLPATAQNDPAFMQLWQTLQQYDFKLKIQRPPRANTFGLFQGRTKTIWINPVVFELGNARPVLAHEAVHAAQYCASGGVPIQPLGLTISSAKQLRPYYLRYHQTHRRQIEAEAYTVQIQPDRMRRAISLLQQHCS